MAHIRRKFVVVQKATSKKVVHGTAKEILDLIGLLYKVEHNIKDLSPDEKIEKLREQAVPILEAIRTILDDRINHVPPKSLLGQAMIYARNQWSRAVRYVNFRLLAPNTKVTENVIRFLPSGRKNWLFAGVPKGADASALLFFLVETARGNEIETQAYLKILFEKFFLAQTKEDMRALMPWPACGQIFSPKFLQVKAAQIMVSCPACLTLINSSLEKYVFDQLFTNKKWG